MYVCAEIISAGACVPVTGVFPIRNRRGFMSKIKGHLSHNLALHVLQARRLEMAEQDYQPSSSSVTEERKNRDSIKKGFEDFKRFASTNFTRAVQVRKCIASYIAM